MDKVQKNSVNSVEQRFIPRSTTDVLHMTVGLDVHLI
jgi:hypothetical protein